MIDRDMLEYLVELGEDRKSVQRFEVPGVNHKSFIVLEGEIQELPHDAPRLNSTVLDTGTLQLMWNRDSTENKEIWVDSEKIVLILNADSYRDHRVKMDMPLHPLFRTLANTQTWRNAKEFRTFLYQKCSSATLDPGDLDLKISDLKFKTEDEQKTGATKNVDSMGRSIRSEVWGTEDLPDIVHFTFLPWPNLEEEYQEEVTIGCKMIVDPSERVISIVPIEGMVSQLLKKSISKLADKIREIWQLDESSNLVYCGTP